jgi:hypothetical protein
LIVWHRRLQCQSAIAEEKKQIQAKIAAKAIEPVRQTPVTINTPAPVMKIVTKNANTVTINPPVTENVTLNATVTGNGGYGWFRSPNVVCLEQYRRRRKQFRGGNEPGDCRQHIPLR